MTENFREMPILLGINPFTGLPDGDDTGYRGVTVSELDEADPDPLVVVNEILPVYAAYHSGCEQNPKGLAGASPLQLVREPVLRALDEVNRKLRASGFELVVLDGWRSSETQMEGWKSVRAQQKKAYKIYKEDLSIWNEVRIGLMADAIMSYCTVVKDESFLKAKDRLRDERAVDLGVASEKLGRPLDEIAELYLTFRANLGDDGFTIDTSAPTAHGSGGSIDLWLKKCGDKRPLNLGVFFDYPHIMPDLPSPSKMDFFETSDLSTYARIVNNDPRLQKYIGRMGYGSNLEKAFYDAQMYRRILFHTIKEFGGSIYIDECWHFQFGNEWGGRQTDPALYGSGNACHAILTGKPVAVWGNRAAHRLAGEIMRR